MMEGESAMETLLRTHTGFGTTSLLLTTVTDTHQKLKDVFSSVQKVKANNDQVLGVHLEGPYLSEKKMGAQPHFMRAFSLDEILELHHISPIKVITLAPESNLSAEDLDKLKQQDIIIQLGHTNATYEESLKFFNTRAQSVTHLFNAMSPLHHRSPGLVGAALAHAQYAELIPDLVHVHQGAIQVALRSIPDLYFVTDATAASGMPDGDYQLGSHQVHKCANGVRLQDGTLAGSCLTMDQALRNLLTLGLSPKECARRLSGIQASLLGLSDRGVLAPSKRADLVVMSSDFHVKNVYIKGKEHEK